MGQTHRSFFLTSEGGEIGLELLIRFAGTDDILCFQSAV